MNIIKFAITWLELVLFNKFEMLILSVQSNKLARINVLKHSYVLASQELDALEALQFSTIFNNLLSFDIED